MKYLSIIKYVLLVVSFVLVALGISGTMEVDTMLVWGACMLFLAIALVVVMPLLGIAQNPKSATGSLVGLGALVVIFLISYALSNEEPIRLANGEIIDDSFRLKFSDTALYATYITFGIVVVSMIFGEVYKSIKN